MYRFHVKMMITVIKMLYPKGENWKKTITFEKIISLFVGDFTWGNLKLLGEIWSEFDKYIM